MKATCEKCGKSFSKPTKQQALAAMRMHFGRVHGKIKTPRQPRAPGVDAEDAISHVAIPPDELRRLEKRQYQREWSLKRKKMLQKAKREWEIHFCPTCGTNIAVVKMGMEVAARAQ